MWNGSRVVLMAGLLAGLAACSQNRPGDYAAQRPPVDSLHEDDRGLQSKDLMSCTDLMVSSLLQSPKLRNSPTQWTLVVDRVEDRTLDRQFNTNYDIFLERLRVAVGKYGMGNVTLLENKQKLGQLRSKELDQPVSEFGQGAGPAGMGRIQPRYALYAKAYDMPNRATNTFMLEFVVTNMQTGEQVWINDYTVKAAR